MNIRNFVSNDHIMSANEIAQTQSAIIQAYMLEVEQLQRELKEVYDKLTDKDRQIEQLTNNWNELEEWVRNDKEKAMVNFECGRCFNMFDILDKMKEISGRNDKERNLEKH